MLPGRSQEQKKRKFLSFFSSSSGDDGGDEARATRSSTMAMMTKQPCRVPDIPVVFRCVLRYPFSAIVRVRKVHGMMGLAAIWHVFTQCCPQSNEAILPNDTVAVVIAKLVAIPRIQSQLHSITGNIPSGGISKSASGCQVMIR